MDPATALIQAFCARSIVATHASDMDFASLCKEVRMGRSEIRPLRSEDFAPLMRLEEDVFGANGEKTLGPYYVGLCCEFFTDTFFIAFGAGGSGGDVVCFVRVRGAYWPALA